DSVRSLVTLEVAAGALGLDVGAVEAALGVDAGHDAAGGDRLTGQRGRVAGALDLGDRHGLARRPLRLGFRRRGPDAEGVGAGPDPPAIDQLEGVPDRGTASLSDTDVSALDTVGWSAGRGELALVGEELDNLVVSIDERDSIGRTVLDPVRRVIL